MQDWKCEEMLAREVRLFPTIRISSEREAELRATAALCAMIRAVSEFGRSVVRMAGGPAGTLSCYTEVAFELDDDDQTKMRPDALIRVTRGKTEWKAMVEVKVGDNPLRDDQVGDYHRLARQEGFDAVVTISNQTALPNGMPPVTLDMRRVRATPVIHLSWDRLLSEAQLLQKRKGIEDSDQRWMLEEWVKYVADPASRIISAPSLGEHWNTVLQAAREGNLVAVSKKLEPTVALWDAFLKKVGLGLRAKLGVEVERKIAKADRDDPGGRARRLTAEALSSGVLEGSLRIPDAVSDVGITVNLQAKTVRFGVEVRPPSDGRVLTRVNWIARQLRRESIPANALLRVQWSRRSVQSQARVADLGRDVTVVMKDHDGRPIGKDLVPKKFLLEWTNGLQKGRGKSTARVLDGIASDLERFYREVVEGIVAYVPKAPRLPVARSVDSSPESSIGLAESRAMDAEDTGAAPTHGGDCSGPPEEDE